MIFTDPLSSSSSNFCVSRGGIHDIKRHVDGSVHLQRVAKNASIAVTKITPPGLCAQMVQFIAAHNLPFQAADYLSDFSSMFPDSRIAADFKCKHTMTKAIICDAFDPY